jgi:hypothetical protein
VSETAEHRRRRGRREDEIDPTLPVHRRQFAQGLRDLRVECGSPPYKELAKRAGYGDGTLSEAANGRRLPTSDVMIAYVTACLKHARREQEVEQIVGQWKDRLREANTQEVELAAVSGAAPEPVSNSQMPASPEPIVTSGRPEQPAQDVTVAIGSETPPIELTQTQDGEKSGGKGDDVDLAPKSRRRVWVAVLLAAAAVAAVVSGATTHWWGLSSEQSDPPKTWPATIDNTWSERLHAYLGVFKYRNPDEPGATDKSFYAEDTVVQVVCQSRHRRLVEDETMKKSSDVWNKLQDGYWIPDLYTNLPKDKPLGIPDCPD